ncbi:hypothetical protein EBU71_20590, partial [bacterium]|nr:hypothetical protein [Candidatus Elulimicrobium humile]
RTQTPTQTPTRTQTPTVTSTQTPTPTPTTIKPQDIQYFVNCVQITPCESQILEFGPSDNPNLIFSDFSRFSLFGSHLYPNTNQLTGLQSGGTVSSGNSSVYFWTGSTNYLGSYAITMNEGQNIGPVTASLSNLDDFYYNSFINKFVVCQDVFGNNTYSWVTFNPTNDVGINLGNPTASQLLTTSSNWGITPIPNTLLTVSGGTVVTATTKIIQAGGVPDMVKNINNGEILNGFYSLCEYDDYVHEVTIGSGENNRETIGIVLAAKKGLGTNPKATDMLTLTFTNRITGSNPIPTGLTAVVTYNLGQEEYAFNDGLNNTGSTSVYVMTGATSPFLQVPPNFCNFYSYAGQVRVKIVKTGNVFEIYTTQRMGGGGNCFATVIPQGLTAGTSNPYTLLYSFDLSNENTWNAASGLTYVTGNELLKFTGSTKFG